MKRALLPLFAFAVLCGCRAHMMETRGDTLQLFNIGKDKPGKGGVIRYLTGGPAAFKKARRSDAEKQMRKFCSGDYTVTAEGPRSRFGADMPIAKGGLETDEYWYVAFDCAPK